MLDISKCEYEESFTDEECGQRVYYFIYPKDIGMAETEFYTEEDYGGNVVSMCVSLTVQEDGETYMQMSPTIDEQDCLSDVDWRDLFPGINYDDDTIAALLKKSAKATTETTQDCPLGGDIANDCADCVYSGDYHYVDGECVGR